MKVFYSFLHVFEAIFVLTLEQTSVGELCLVSVEEKGFRIRSRIRLS